jgi:hypothetical protein
MEPKFPESMAALPPETFVETEVAPSPWAPPANTEPIRSEASVELPKTDETQPTVISIESMPGYEAVQKEGEERRASEAAQQIADAPDRTVGGYTHIDTPPASVAMERQAQLDAAAKIALRINNESGSNNKSEEE